MQEALLLKEGFRETARQLEQAIDYDARFLTWMKEAEQTATRLEAVLTSGDMAGVESAFLAVQHQCKRCHAEYRD